MRLTYPPFFEDDNQHRRAHSRGSEPPDDPTPSTGGPFKKNNPGHPCICFDCPRCIDAQDAAAWEVELDGQPFRLRNVSACLWTREIDAEVYCDTATLIVLQLEDFMGSGTNARWHLSLFNETTLLRSWESRFNVPINCGVSWTLFDNHDDEPEATCPDTDSVTITPLPACCPCEGGSSTVCDSCIDEILPTHFLVEMSGVANFSPETCEDCTELNAAFVLSDHLFGERLLPCIRGVQVPTCGQTFIQFGINNLTALSAKLHFTVFAPNNFLFDFSRWEKTVARPYDCTAIDEDVTGGWTNTDPGEGCDFSGATIHLSAM